jgi:peroxidase
MQGGGPRYKVPLGRRDGLKPAPEAEVLAGQPGPTTNVTGLLAVFSTFNLDAVDLVTLLGAHTVGRAECLAFENRLFPARDPTMAEWFFDFLKLVCPVEGASSEAVNDIRTPIKFDNQYYVDLLNGVGLFTADQDLFENTTTRPIVAKFALDQNAFFDQFAFSNVKMGMIDVLTGWQGEIRRNCFIPNTASPSSSSSLPWSVIELLYVRVCVCVLFGFVVAHVTRVVLAIGVCW